MMVQLPCDLMFQMLEIRTAHMRVRFFQTMVVEIFQNLMPLLFGLTRLLGQPLIFRPLGSGLKEQYEAYGSFRRWLFHRTVLSAEVLYLQTEALMEFFQPLGGRAKLLQLPTTRDVPVEQRPSDRPFQKRFVYLGHIKTSKGID